MLDALTLPDGLSLVRTTPTFDAASVPDGLLKEHRVAPGRWGVLRVAEGTVRFVLEATGEARDVTAGEHQVIEPDTAHHVEVGDGARFAVEFYR